MSTLLDSRWKCVLSQEKVDTAKEYLIAAALKIKIEDPNSATFSSSVTSPVSSPDASPLPSPSPIPRSVSQTNSNDNDGEEDITMITPKKSQAVDQ